MIYVEQSLSDTCTYAGNEQLTAANGQGQYLSIFATSSLALPTLFSHVITLQKVNFVPKLSANLIFVGPGLTFLFSGYVIQEQETRKMIKTGSKHGGSSFWILDLAFSSRLLWMH